MESIVNCDVSNVTNISDMFKGCNSFNNSVSFGISRKSVRIKKIKNILNEKDYNFL